MSKALDGNCWKSRVPSTTENDYTCVVEDSFELRVGDSVRFVLGGLSMTKHLFPLLLLGADIFCGGHKVPSWNYEGISLTMNSGTGSVFGDVRFR